jgi:hypothetical protein
VIARIGTPDSDEWRRTDKVFRHLIQPAVRECGYEPELAHQIQKPGIITRQIIDRLIEVPLVVADLTGYNPNVFYELAIRHAFRRPLVQLIQQGHPIPFDVSPARTIQLDYPDPDGILEARSQLVQQIKAVEKDPSLVDNPISDAIDLKGLRDSGKPLEAQLAKVFEAISELRAEVNTLKSPARGSAEPFSFEDIVAGNVGVPHIVATSTGRVQIPPPPRTNVRSAEEDRPK